MRPGATPAHDPKEKPATTTITVPGVRAASAAHPPRPMPGAVGIGVPGVPPQSKTGFQE